MVEPPGCAQTLGRLMTLLVFGSGLLGFILGGQAATFWPAIAQDGPTPAPAPVETVCRDAGFTPAIQIALAIDPGPGATVTPDILERTRDIVEQRAAAISPDGCAVSLGADGRLLVQLPPIDDLGAALQLLTGTARLEIVDTGGVFLERGSAVEIATGPTPGPTPGASPAATPGAPVAPGGITAVPILTGADIVAADVTQGASGRTGATITLTPEAAARFSAYTAVHIGQPLAIVLDGRVISAPIIQSVISDGVIVIDGDFSPAEIEALVIQLQGDALPLPLTVLEISTPTSAPATASPAATPPATPVPAGDEITGVASFAIESAAHTLEPVSYPQSPPVGGMHDPRWQTCGFYDAPVRNEHAVHTLEHGVVWITYSPDLPPAQVDALRQITVIDDRLLVSPYPGLDAPVVLSTWDRQLRLDSVDDPRLLAFIAAYAGQSPEPNATCQGGVGTPA